MHNDKTRPLAPNISHHPADLNTSRNMAMPCTMRLLCCMLGTLNIKEQRPTCRTCTEPVLHPGAGIAILLFPWPPLLARPDLNNTYVLHEVGCMFTAPSWPSRIYTRQRSQRTLCTLTEKKNFTADLDVQQPLRPTPEARLSLGCTEAH